MTTEASQGATPLLRARNLTKSFKPAGMRRISRLVAALQGVDFEVARGAMTAVVGQSGAGKSTLARCLARLEQPDSGEIWFDGREISALQGDSLLGLRRSIQMVFQDPAGALNPRFSCREIVQEPLDIQRIGAPEDRRARAQETIERMGLPASCWGKRPRELSGGQRQRLALARALILEPQLLILDEALSGLDLSTQAQLVNLLMDLRAARKMTCLYISHDLSLVAHLADEVNVMYEGRIVERAPARELFANPQHPHTRELLDSMPSLTAAPARARSL
jgi:ABC-type glutathione transport system ATPase component